jgi:hypothetical protein
MEQEATTLAVWFLLVLMREFLLGLSTLMTLLMEVSNF